MFSTFIKLPWQIKIAIFFMMLSVLVDFSSTVLSIASDLVFDSIAIWAIVSMINKNKDN